MGPQTLLLDRKQHKSVQTSLTFTPTPSPSQWMMQCHSLAPFPLEFDHFFQMVVWKQGMFESHLSPNVHADTDDSWVSGENWLILLVLLIKQSAALCWTNNVMMEHDKLKGLANSLSVASVLKNTAAVPQSCHFIHKVISFRKLCWKWVKTCMLTANPRLFHSVSYWSLDTVPGTYSSTGIDLKSILTWLPFQYSFSLPLQSLNALGKSSTQVLIQLVPNNTCKSTIRLTLSNRATQNPIGATMKTEPKEVCRTKVSKITTG